MSFLQALAAAAGTWQGTNRLHSPETGQHDDSPSTLTVTPVLDGRFVRLDYTWTFQGDPQTGSLLVGHENEANVDTAYWIDSFHNGDKGMLCRGPATDGDTATVLGAFAAPPGPDWGWDIVLTPNARESFEIVMHIYTPQGEQGPAVDASYKPAG